MGFRREAKVYNLKFADGEFSGLQVKTRSMSLGGFVELIELVDGGALSRDNVNEIFTRFAGVLISWNVEDPETGAPVPPTVEGLYTQELDLVQTVIEAWRDAVQGVSGPLGTSSSDGEPSLAESIPMDTLSASQAS